MTYAAALAILAASVVHAADPAPARIADARILPYFAAGGGWESTISLVNVVDEGVDYQLAFYGSNGQPARVTFRDGQNRITAAEVFNSRLNDDGSEVITILDSGPLQTGWAMLMYDGETRIGGSLVFRQRVSGRPDYEAAVPLSLHDETRFHIPFDNTGNFATTLALTNPSLTDATDVRLRFWDPSGSEIITRDLRLAAGTTVAFSLREQYPELNNRVGQGRIEGSSGRLSGIALRFNPDGAFTTVPVSSR